MVGYPDTMPRKHAHLPSVMVNLHLFPYSSAIANDKVNCQ
jgi:hypothetical protein